MSQFEQDVKAHKEKKLRTPIVSVGKTEVDYFDFALRTHKFNLSLMAKGLTFRNIKFKEIKAYYGLKGRGAKECLPEFEKLIENYEANKGK